MALPGTACPPSSTKTTRPRKKVQVERDANDPAPWCEEMSEVWIGFEALTSVIYLMQNKVVIYWPLERTASIKNQHHAAIVLGVYKPYLI
jgi:hypothetical protein